MDIIHEFFSNVYNVPELIRIVGFYGLILIVFAETGLLVGFFLPGDSLLITAGLFAARGDFDVAMLLLALIPAAIIGNATGYYIGHRTGMALYSRPDSLLFRREHLRIPVRLYLSFSGGKIRGEGTVLDLSMGGCIIKSETHVRVDDIFYLEISTGPHEPPLEVAAMVRSVSPRGIAFKFLRAAQDNKRLLAFIQAQTADHLQKSAASAVAVKG